MINVCTECLKINPLEMTICHYCKGKCEEITNARLNTFLIELNDRRREKEAQKAKKISSKEVKNEPEKEDNVQWYAEDGM